MLVSVRLADTALRSINLIAIHCFSVLRWRTVRIPLHIRLWGALQNCFLLTTFTLFKSQIKLVSSALFQKLRTNVLQGNLDFRRRRKRVVELNCFLCLYSSTWEVKCWEKMVTDENFGGYCRDDLHWQRFPWFLSGGDHIVNCLVSLYSMKCWHNFPRDEINPFRTIDRHQLR